MNKKRRTVIRINTVKEEKEPVSANEKIEIQDTFCKRDILVSAFIFIFTQVVYFLTLAPSVFFGDSGELTAAAYNLGIAHPPGYPLYLLLGKLVISLLWIGDPAYRMNLLSSFLHHQLRSSSI